MEAAVVCAADSPGGATPLDLSAQLHHNDATPGISPRQSVFPTPYHDVLSQESIHRHYPGTFGSTSQKNTHNDNSVEVWLILWLIRISYNNNNCKKLKPFKTSCKDDPACITPWKPQISKRVILLAHHQIVNVLTSNITLFGICGFSGEMQAGSSLQDVLNSFSFYNYICCFIN